MWIYIAICYKYSYQTVYNFCVAAAIENQENILGLSIDNITEN